MFNKISPQAIFVDHFNTLIDHHTQKKKTTDFILFLVLPAVIASVIIALFPKVLTNVNTVEILITVFSILIGLMLNLLVLMFDIMIQKHDKSEQKSMDGRTRKVLLKQTFSNISFAILVSVLTIILLFITIHQFPSLAWINPLDINSILNWMILFLTMNFFLTLFMILKRVYKLLETI